MNFHLARSPEVFLERARRSAAFGYFDDDADHRVLSDLHREPARWAEHAVHAVHLVFEHDGDLVIDRRRLEPLTGRCLTERIIVRDGRIRRIPFFVRLLTFTELRGWLRDAGFDEVTGHDENGALLSADSHRMIVVARR